MRVRRLDWVPLVLAVTSVISCSGGGGCGGCASITPIPGGFPSADRTPNAAQVRLSQTGLTALTADPAELVSTITGVTGVQTFNVPADCTSSPTICCPNGSAQSPCGPVDIDITQHAGDTPRLVLTPKQGASELDLTVRARVKSEMDIPVHEGISCTVKIDTTASSPPDIEVDAPIDFVQDAVTGNTRLNVGAITIQDLSTDDVTLEGGFTCDVANFGLSFFLSDIESAIESQLQSTIQNEVCKTCPSGDVADCGSPFATQCTNGVCEESSGQCFQNLGVDGHLPASLLFSSFSPSTTGAINLYEVIGGYGTTNNSGVALGLLGGLDPAGSAHDLCGPPATAPAPVTIPQSAFFQGNTRPDTGAAFGMAIGLHQSQLTELAYAGYNGGLFCLTVGYPQVSQLTTDTIGLLAPSLKKDVPEPSAVEVGLRPQSPPVITLGSNAVDSSGNLTDPLLDIKFTQMEIDFFVAINDQYVRAFTVVADVDLPVGLQVGGTGQLVPVLGDVTHAFTNVSVKNTEAVTESAADLASVFPQVLGLVVPELISGLGSFSLPTFGGLELSISDITAVDNNAFLAIFADLEQAPAPVPPVRTRADVVEVYQADPKIVAAPHLWSTVATPSVSLRLGGNSPDLEWQYKTDGGVWSPWTKNPQLHLARGTFWLVGTHQVTVRARRIGHPETIDDQGVTIDVPFGPQAAPKPRVDVATGSSASGSGCNAGAGGGAGGWAFACALAIGAMVIRRRRARVLGAIAVAAAAASACGSSTSNPCGSKDCKSGDVTTPALGRWSSVAADSKRVLAATYEQSLGDLVVVDATAASAPTYTVVDGIPADATPTYDPSGYRGGIADPGPDVGAWTSIVLTGGSASVAYQDIDDGALKYAFETAPGTWQSYVVDPGSGGSATPVGAYAAMVIDGNNRPAIAYLAVGVDDGAGHRVTELKLARAANSTPQMSDWTTSVIDNAPGSCAGLCATGDSCVVGADATDPQSCITPTADCGSACGSDQVCSTGTCVDTVAELAAELPPTGTGLYVSLVVLPDGTLAAAYYDTTRGALVLANENGAQTSQFTETVLDGNVAGANVGAWASAAAATDGTVHVAYQDVLHDELMYTTWSSASGPGVPVVVDDGTRTGDRPHPVGAAAAIYLANGSPAIAYQDGMVADVLLATPMDASNATWTNTGIATNPTRDGFFIGVTTAGATSPIYAWQSIDPTKTPVTSLVVQSQ